MKTDPSMIESSIAGLSSYGEITKVAGIIDQAVEAMYGHRTTAWQEHGIFVYADPGIRSTRILVDNRTTVAVNNAGELLIRTSVNTTAKRIDIINAALARFNPEYQVVQADHPESTVPVLLYRGESVNWAGIYTLGAADRVEI